MTITRRGRKTHWSTLRIGETSVVKQGNMTWKRACRQLFIPKISGDRYILGPQPKQRFAVLLTYPEALTIIHPLFYI